MSAYHSARFLSSQQPAAGRRTMILTEYLVISYVFQTVDQLPWSSNTSVLAPRWPHPLLSLFPFSAKSLHINISIPSLRQLLVRTSLLFGKDDKEAHWRSSDTLGKWSMVTDAEEKKATTDVTNGIV
ncbi:hypothetical protein O0I10_003270 [Lichtheimia ornata]|uniref:Uncharacterized protein n=1 Tax=Lichtheimia ornata TaxID=688661 RepID=A0AAD7V8P2_9FUNG|nr:uncharacterized protein O0I10_003270 [Lichtheimia ornata]KAJ8661047.1 hypothetical protein O0I10_003270 [Lichtheimia ornata]